MKSTTIVALALVSFLPLFAFAQGIRSVTISSSDSGGIVAEETVTGDSSASASVQTTMGPEGSRVEITTEQDGVQRTEIRQIGTPRRPAAEAKEVRQDAEVEVFAETSVKSDISTSHDEMPPTREYSSWTVFHSFFKSLFWFFW